MLRIHQFFFLNTLVLFLGTLLLASFVSYFTLKEMVVQNTIAVLENTLELVTVQSYRYDRPDGYVHAIYNQTGYRATLFDQNGTAIAESAFDYRSLEPQNRVEIMNSAIQSYGVAVRYSRAMDAEYIFAAKLIPYNGNIVILRLGVSLQSAMEYFYTLWIRLTLLFALFVLIALVLSYRISLKARHDVQQITLYLNDIANKQYTTVLKPEYFHEFLYISLLLKNMVKKIRNRDKQKRKYTAKLRLINKQQNDILSAISHEFKNPVAAIAGYTETLRDDLTISLAIREKFLGKIHSNALKISHMLDRLALSVKLENNDLSIKPTSFDMDMLCRDVISSLSGKYPLRKIIYEGTPAQVVADKTMIDLVITNLIDNAIKYSDDVVTLKLTDHTVEIIDKGIGIAPNELENITQKFYRVQKNSWDNSMGLGLAIVSYILTRHHSQLVISSELHVGSIFSFSIDNFKAPLLQK